MLSPALDAHTHTHIYIYIHILCSALQPFSLGLDVQGTAGFFKQFRHHESQLANFRQHQGGTLTTLPTPSQKDSDGNTGENTVKQGTCVTSQQRCPKMLVPHGARWCPIKHHVFPWCSWIFYLSSWGSPISGPPRWWKGHTQLGRLGGWRGPIPHSSPKSRGFPWRRRHTNLCIDDQRYQR